MKKLILLLLCFVSIGVSIFCVKDINVYANDKIDGINAKNYIVIDSSGNILTECNSEARSEVASICKLMTSLITLEKLNSGEISLDTKFIVSEKAADAEGSRAFLDAGSEYSVGDLLKSVVVASANDSAIVLAEGIAGSEKNFVKLMNEKAKEIGMYNTVYANATGLPASEQYSTALDTSIILSRVGQYDIYCDYSKIWIDSLTHPSGRVTELVNTNRMVKYYTYCETGKTGFTDEAGYCLATKNTKDGMTIYTVVLGCKSSADRFTDSIELCNYAFANYRSKQVLVAGESIENSVKVDKGKKEDIDLIISKDYYLTTPTTSDGGYTIHYELPKTITATINKGDIVGKALVIRDGVIISEVDVLANETIEKESYRDVLGKIVEKFAVFR